MKTPDDYLQGWFGYLDQIRDCAGQISNDVKDDVTNFSRQKLAAILVGDPQKEQLRSCVAARCGLYVADKALSQKTFLDFLEYIYQPLHGYVLGVFQEQAGSAYADLPPTDFDAKAAKDVYTSDVGKQLLIKALRSDMPDIWFPNSKVSKVLQALASEKKIKDVVDLVATSGDTK